MLDSGDATLSFSGVKTSLRNFIEDHPDKDFLIEDVCASYQYAIVEALSRKLKSAQQIAHAKCGFDLPIVFNVEKNSIKLQPNINWNFIDVTPTTQKFIAAKNIEKLYYIKTKEVTNP